jgi:tripartite-type tricarboxylate transporter receptor subunit TctC
MKSFRRHLLAVVACVNVAIPLADAFAQSQAFPSRAITIVVPFPPGGISDVTTRHIAQAAAGLLGQQIVVDNKPGAGGQIGADAVKRANADGYTLYLANIGSHAINESLYDKLSYDPVRDFEPVAGLFLSANMVLVNAANPARSVADLLAQAKVQAGKFTYGSQGVGSGGHLSGVIFKTHAGVDLVHVPYRGSVPALADLVGDRIGLLFDPLTNAMPFVREGKLRALAVTSAQRSPLFPELPTLRELGIADNDVNPWFGLAAPAGTPPAVVARLNEAFNAALKDPVTRARMSAQAIEPMAGSASDFGRFMRAEAARWKPVVAASGARAD